MNYIGETGKLLQIRVGGHIKAEWRMDSLSPVAEHCANYGHTFDFQNAEILGRGNDLITREAIKAWRTGSNTINRCVALPKVYQALRTQLNGRGRLRQDRNPSMAEYMGDTRAAVLQPESDGGAVVTTAAAPTYPAAKWLNSRLKRLTHGSDYSINNSQAFLRRIQGLKAQPLDRTCSLSAAVIWTLRIGQLFTAGWVSVILDARMSDVDMRVHMKNGAAKR
nr:unnamed protein product [Spirometra erinaceieuropaei]